MSKPTSFFSRLTARERLLIGVFAAMLVVSGAIIFALLPGLDAVEAAESRRTRAADELGYVRQLAAQVTTARETAASLPPEQAQTVITETALTYGVQVLASTIEGAGVRLTVDAPGTARLLEWVDAASAQAAMGVLSLSLRRGESGALTADIVFSREIP